MKTDIQLDLIVLRTLKIDTLEKIIDLQAKNAILTDQIEKLEQSMTSAIHDADEYDLMQAEREIIQ